MEAVGGAGTTERKSCSLHSPLIGIVSQNANWVQKTKLKLDASYIK